ncbi:odorant receptor 30a-like isoform X2 [Cylas formicarius]|uniref:odorant receptor 30a-like isoform X2 n=1 Tax=Cylas formicarius TaxID=197179 RepID=UPI002958BB6C|nr:odorant receptor 30a-like isoform X2 [Cylas formicarius]
MAINRNILNFPKCIMIIFGVWRNHLTSNTIVQKFYIFYSLFIHIYMLIFVSSMFTWVAVALTGVNNSAEKKDKIGLNITYLITIFTIMLKVVLCQTKNIRRTIAFVQEEEKKINSSEDLEILDTHLEQVRFCTSINVILFICHVVLFVFAVVENIVTRLSIERHNKAHNETLIKPVIYELYYHNMDPIKYETLFVVFDDIGGTILISLSVSTNIILSCVIFVSSMLKVLQTKLRKMIVQTGDIMSALKKLAKEHQQVIGFVEDLNESVKYLILIEYTTISLNIALVTLRFIKEKSYLMRIGRSFYCGFLVIYILALGWSSNEIKMQSVAIGDAIYESSWYEHNKKAQEMLLVMMMRTQRPLTMTKGPFDEMTLQSSLMFFRY